MIAAKGKRAKRRGSPGIYVRLPAQERAQVKIWADAHHVGLPEALRRLAAQALRHKLVAEERIAG